MNNYLLITYNSQIRILINVYFLIYFRTIHWINVIYNIMNMGGIYFYPAPYVPVTQLPGYPAARNPKHISHASIPERTGLYKDTLENVINNHFQ